MYVFPPPQEIPGITLVTEEIPLPLMKVSAYSERQKAQTCVASSLASRSPAPSVAVVPKGIVNCQGRMLQGVRLVV